MENIILERFNPTRAAIAAEAFVSKGKSGFSPVCKYKFDKKAGCRIKQGVKNPCKDCPIKSHRPLDADLIRDHLNGKKRVGIYPLMTGNITTWVAADLDNHDGTKNPATDAKQLIGICEEFDIPIRIFSSFSGAGYHAYIFFDKPVRAFKARNLILALLDRSGIDISQRRTSDDSFDCIFPKQNTLHGLNIGNLIALPWSGKSNGATLLLNPSTLEPIAPDIESNVNYFNDEFEAMAEKDIDAFFAECGINAKDDPISKKASSDPSDSALDRAKTLESITEKCLFLKHCKDDAEKLSEPEWYLMICSLAREFGGPALIHELSRKYPKYDANETNAKIIHALNDQPGPITCDGIKAVWNCNRDCRVVCPVHLKDKQIISEFPAWVNEFLWGVPKGKRTQCAEKLAAFYLDTYNGNDALTRDALTTWNTRNTPPLSNDELIAVISTVSAKQGMMQLSKYTSCPIYQVEILKYPDGDVKYSFIVEGIDDSITLSPEDIISPNKFRTLFMTLTKKILKPIKNDQWFPLLEQVLSEAKEIEMSEDETLLAVIKRTIHSDIKRGEYEQPEAYIDNNIVLYNGKIHLFIDVLNRHLQFQGIRIKDRKEIGQVLRKIGFKTRSVRINKRMAWTWHMTLASFRHNAGYGEIVAIKSNNDKTSASKTK